VRFPFFLEPGLHPMVETQSIIDGYESGADSVVVTGENRDVDP